MRKLLWPRQTLLALARLIRRNRWEIIHVHSLEAGLCGRLTGLLASGSRRPNAQIVYTPQTIDILHARWHRLYRLIERLLSNATDAIISVNEADRQRLLQWGIPARRVVTIPNGIEIPHTIDYPDAAYTRRSLGLDPDRPVVMQVARLSAQKDPVAFVDGAAHVAQAHPAAQFVMVGQGPLKERVLARVQALGLQAHVRLLGWHDQAHLLMAAADVVTLTSRWEGAPYSLLEAMAASRPVVATTVNGCPEIVVDRETGYLTPPGDVATWAARVGQLIDRPQMREKMGHAARKRTEREFSVQATTARTAQLYQRLVQARGLTRGAR